MTSIEWCKKQPKGLRLVDPSQRISREYELQASSDLEQMGRSNDKWRTITGYYACYNALYSLLALIGIKSEIHDCTLALMHLLGFEKADTGFMEKGEDRCALLPERAFCS